MNKIFTRSFVLPVLLSTLFVSSSFAATVVTAAVTPSIAVAGGKVFIHSAVSNPTITNEAVSVTLNVTNPGNMRHGTSAFTGRRFRFWPEAERLGLL
jgi:hypothetical protein